RSLKEFAITALINGEAFTKVMYSLTWKRSKEKINLAKHSSAKELETTSTPSKSNCTLSPRSIACSISRRKKAPSIRVDRCLPLCENKIRMTSLRLLNYKYTQKYYQSSLFSPKNLSIKN